MTDLTRALVDNFKDQQPTLTVLKLFAFAALRERDGDAALISDAVEAAREAYDIINNDNES